ncbi:MAG: 2,3-bisphosphoglycerate-independent phosphoglycerate mutase [Myxococcota bacterium]|jgi:2,3-bisphosphoglycerate-independent phosphoglycerate mutase
MRPVVLCILDGVGWGRRDDGDAFHLAHTPCLDRLLTDAPWCLLKAHGTAVGMPNDGDMGNSEVGHNAMGAGRIFDQGASLVNQAIETGRIWQSEAWQEVTATTGTLHLLGLVSDGNVHAHVDHLHALIRRAVEDGVGRVRVHILTDGRDVGSKSALTWVEPLEAMLAALPGDCAVATGGGRMFITMDRYEADWEMVARGWRCHVHAEGRRFASATEAITTLYDEDPRVNDQNLSSFVIGDYAGMADGDAVVLFNFRGDRAIEISRAFDDDALDTFDRGERPSVTFAGMMEYDGDLHIPRRYLVSPPVIDDTVGERLSAAGRTVFSISETQKFGHVTFFFNGNRSAAMAGETWREVPSAVVSFDELPEMSAEGVTEQACAAITSGDYDHIRLNLANGDMVGHTGVLSATVTAVTFLDACVARLEAAVREAGGILLITADHGNADEMFQVDKKTGEYVTAPDGTRRPSTSHSRNPVPLILLDTASEWALTQPTADAEVVGSIARIGATILSLCGLTPPEVYEDTLVQKR